MLHMLKRVKELNWPAKPKAILFQQSNGTKTLSWMAFHLIGIRIHLCILLKSVVNRLLDSRFFVHQNGSLTIENVLKEDDGYYGCTAGNAGGFKRAEFRLVVEGIHITTNITNTILCYNCQSLYLSYRLGSRQSRRGIDCQDYYHHGRSGRCLYSVICRFINLVSIETPSKKVAIRKWST